MATSINSDIGGATANSYVSVASADQYFELRDDSSSWDDLVLNSTGTISGTQAKSNKLIQATREIDNTFRFQGVRDGDDVKESEDYQNLEFPRAENTDADGNLLIPDEIKYTTYEQALWIMLRNSPQTASGENVVKLPKFSEQAYDYLKPWVTRAVVKVGRYGWQGSEF